MHGAPCKSATGGMAIIGYATCYHVLLNYAKKLLNT